MLELLSEFTEISGNEITGLSLSVSGFDSDNCVLEDVCIRKKLDAALEVEGLQPIGTVANTIFPINLWNKASDRSLLYKRYMDILPQIKKCPQNRYGIYFNRMINYDDKGFNQIERIISFYEKKNRRRSAFQVSIWDPHRDLVNTRMRGFPCMQHLVFSCVQNKIVVTSFYATQYVFERAYGNILGICNLGSFLAHELGIPLKEVNCFVGVEQLSIGKTRLDKILKSA
jgi:hypothetical protein